MNTANLRRLLDKATPRPWNMRHRHCSGPGEPTPDVDEIAGLGWDWDDESPYNTPPEPMRGVLSRGADAALIVELVNNAEALLEENERLRAALRDAIDCVDDWGMYATEYFREKHDLEGELARLNAALEGKP